MPRRLAPATAAILLALPLGAAVASSAGQGRISDAEAQHLNRDAVRALASWHARHGSYEGATVARLAALAPSLGDAAGVRLTRLSADGFRIATHATTGSTFRATRHPRTGRLFLACAPAGTGACGPHGTWGGR